MKQGDWVVDQVIAILREHGRPMNSSEVGQTTPYMWSGPRGLFIRGHTTADIATVVLKRLYNAGVVIRQKVDRRVMWSLSPDYLATTRETTTLAAAILMGADLPDATEEELQAAREIDGYIGSDGILRDWLR